MEGGGGGPLKPFSQSANSLKNVEQRKSDNNSATEMLENCLADKAEGATVPLSSEEMVEIAATRDCPPKSSRVLDVSLQVSHGSECKPDASGSYGYLGTNGSPYWGEEMLRSPDPRSHSSNRNKISREFHHWERHLGNPVSIFSSEKQESTKVPSLHSSGSELKTETLATNNVIEPAEPSHWSSRKYEAVVIKDRVPNGKDDEDDNDPVLLAMFHAVANSHLAVRSQQKDEPDFTSAQKLTILRDLYYTKPLVFLERFRTALREEHLPCFHHLSGSYEADFYCAEVRRASLGKTRHTRVRNKRYAALQQLIRGGEYFSDEQMRCRDPLLYEQYIGQYLSDSELQELGSSKLEASCSLSGVLLDSYQEQVIQQRLQIQQEQEDACEEEEEDEDDDEDNGEAKTSDLDMEEWVPDQEEKTILREEFTSRMYQHFLDGKDGDFDYSEVDENPDFDNLDIVSRDEEERYFDGEDPENADAMDAE